jgi:hypothetical protein
MESPELDQEKKENAAKNSEVEGTKLHHNPAHTSLFSEFL